MLKPPFNSRLYTILYTVIFVFLTLAIAFDLAVIALGRVNAFRALLPILLVPVIPAALKSQPESNFRLKHIQGQSAEVRSYNFTVSTVQGGPDGVLREMLVVNGACLLPILAFPLPMAAGQASIPDRQSRQIRVTEYLSPSRTTSQRGPAFTGMVL
jgi:hypothetical protein